jgi:hypothetical protein
MCRFCDIPDEQAGSIIQRHLTSKQYGEISLSDHQIIHAASIGIYGAQIALMAIDLNLGYYGYELASGKITPDDHNNKVNDAIERRRTVSGDVKVSSRASFHGLTGTGPEKSQDQQFCDRIRARLAAVNHQQLAPAEFGQIIVALTGMHGVEAAIPAGDIIRRDIKYCLDNGLIDRREYDSKVRDLDAARSVAEMVRSKGLGDEFFKKIATGQIGK